MKLVSEITEKPANETDLEIVPGEYNRQICVCGNCGVYNNFHDYDFSDFYSGQYNKMTYANKISDTFNRIRNLPDNKSDNKQRVKRIVEFCSNEKIDLTKTKVLDVGSGLCVFLAELKNYGFKCYCVDPDELSVDHAINNAKVDGSFCSEFGDMKTDTKFDIITFNKVLEHVKDPLPLLDKAREYLNDDGFVYIEVPDASGALAAGTIRQREEFFIEHFTIFTEKALKVLAEKAGYQCIIDRSIHEPSDKFTLYAFLRKSISGVNS